MTKLSDKARQYADRMENGPYVHLKDTRELLRELADENERLRATLEEISESHDAGRHDGLEEDCPAHDDVYRSRS